MRGGVIIICATKTANTKRWRQRVGELYVFAFRVGTRFIFCDCSWLSSGIFFKVGKRDVTSSRNDDFQCYFTSRHGCSPTAKSGALPIPQSDTHELLPHSNADVTRSKKAAHLSKCVYSNISLELMHCWCLCRLVVYKDAVYSSLNKRQWSVMIAVCRLYVEKSCWLTGKRSKFTLITAVLVKTGTKSVRESSYPARGSARHEWSFSVDKY